MTRWVLYSNNSNYIGNYGFRYALVCLGSDGDIVARAHVKLKVKQMHGLYGGLDRVDYLMSSDFDRNFSGIYQSLIEKR